MKDHYVILTGSKNNAGDFLIKYRAKQLFGIVRPDRKIIDINAWENLDKEKLELINDSRALILMGGPALVKDMVPRVYNVEQHIDLIKVPIVLMGIGWKSKRGTWADTVDYKLSRETIKLLNRVKDSGYYSSVRDFYTLEVLRSYGIKNAHMTGCPAYYDINFIGRKFMVEEVRNVAFSLGVSHLESLSMLNQMKEVILELKERFGNKLQIAFHHSLKRSVYLDNKAGLSKHEIQHNRFASWLEANGIGFVDISGSAESLVSYYSKIDLHIGYRVHAHIFMNSISRRSILISEDGRAKGVKGVIDGVVLDGYENYLGGGIHRLLGKYVNRYSRYVPNIRLIQQLNDTLEYEEFTDYRNMKIARSIIDSRYGVMCEFIKQLP